MSAPLAYGLILIGSFLCCFSRKETNIVDDFFGTVGLGMILSVFYAALS